MFGMYQVVGAMLATRLCSDWRLALFGSAGVSPVSSGIQTRNNTG